MFRRNRPDASKPAPYPKHWRKRPPVELDWSRVQERTALLEDVSPAGLAVLDQVSKATRDLIAGFGVHMDDPHELWAVAVGMCVLDTGITRSDISDDAKEECQLFAAACLRGLLPLIGRQS